MAVKVWIEGNYFYYQEDTNPIRSHAVSKVLIKERQGETDVYSIFFLDENNESKRQRPARIALVDFQDELGVSFASKAAFETWYTGSTGEAAGASIAGGVTIDNSGVESRLDALNLNIQKLNASVPNNYTSIATTYNGTDQLTQVVFVTPDGNVTFDLTYTATGKFNTATVS